MATALRAMKWHLPDLAAPCRDSRWTDVSLNERIAFERQRDPSDYLSTGYRQSAGLIASICKSQATASSIEAEIDK
ncbi:MAG: hypothetical protein WBB98_17535 [Xanthobacteraceae bacterium]